jgi:hypothetical protein
VGDLDPLLIVLGPDGVEVARNDDAEATISNSSFDAQIVGFTAAQSGTYTVRATRYQEDRGQSSGSFELSATAATPGSTATNDLPNGGGQIVDGLQVGPAVAVGGSVTGQIGGEVYGVLHDIELRAGQTIAVTMVNTSGDLDPQVLIYNANGTFLSYNDDAAVPVGNNALNAEITGFTAQAAGMYQIVASRYDLDEGTSTGGYELRVSEGVLASANDGGVISTGQTVSGMLSATTYAVEYTISLSRGDQITVTMTRTDNMLDPYLVIRNSDGLRLAYNDDAEVQVGDSALNAQIVDFVAPDNGTYTISATRYLEENGTAVGRFDLSVTTSGTSSK